MLFPAHRRHADDRLSRVSSNATNGDPFGRDVGDVAIDAAIIVFAAWTLVCQMTVAAGGSSWILAAAGSVAAVAAAVVWVGRTPTARVADRRQVEMADTRILQQPVSTCSTLSSSRWFPRTILVVVAAALALATAVLVEVNPPWAFAPAVAGLALGLIGGGRMTIPDLPMNSGRRITVLCVVVAITSTAVLNRSDADDGFYLGLANAVVDRPTDPLLKYDPLHGVPGLELPSRHHRLRTFEAMIGTIALLTGLAPIVVAHVVLPLLAAVGLVLAHRRLLRNLVPDRWPWALLATMVMLLTIGDAHAWHGNFGLVRLHQGKGVLVSVLVPFAIAAAVEYCRRPTWRRWVLLAAVQVAALGFNPTAIWLFPLVVACSLVAAGSLDRDGWYIVVTGGLSSSYLLVVGLTLRAGLAPRFENSIASLDSADLVAWAAGYVLGTAALPTVMAFVSVVAWATVPPGPGRRVLAALPLAMAVIFNPWLAHSFARLATGSQIFWRVLWLVPATALLGIVATSPLALRCLPILVRVVGALAVVVACAVAVPSTQLSASSNGVRRAPFALRIPVPEGEVGRTVARLSPAGAVVLVPLSIGSWVTVWPHHPFPLAVRLAYLNFGGDQEEQRRAFMARWVSGIASAVTDGDRFLEGLDLYRPAIVCLSTNHPAHQWWVEQASARRYVLELTIAEYELWRLSIPPETAIRVRRGDPDIAVSTTYPGFGHMRARSDDSDDSAW